MERKFLENFKVGDQPLPKEIIDAIMAENGRDIEAAKKPFADYDTIKQQLSAAQETIKTFESQVSTAYARPQKSGRRSTILHSPNISSRWTTWLLMAS